MENNLIEMIKNFEKLRDNFQEIKKELDKALENLPENDKEKMIKFANKLKNAVKDR